MVTFVTNCYENLGSGWGTHSFFVTHQIIFLKYTISSYYLKVELSGFKIQCCVCVYTYGDFSDLHPRGVQRVTA